MKKDTGRKAELILEGAAYRSGIVHAGTQVKHDFSAGNVMRVAAGSMVDLAAAGLQSVLPLDGSRALSLLPSALNLGSYISRKKLLKPAIGVGLTAVLAIFLVKLHLHQSGKKSG